jgi:hypothetical protein
MGLIDYDVHCIRIAEIVEMEEGLLLFKEVDRIKAICLSSHAIIDLFRSILVPDAPFSGGFPEVVFKSFSQAINIV